MRNNRTLWIVVLVLLLVLCFCCVAAGGVLVLRAWDWGSYSPLAARVEARDQVTRTLDTRGPIRLSLDMLVGDITVRAGTDQQVVVRATKRAWGSTQARAQVLLDHIDVEIDQAGYEVGVTVTGLTGVRSVPRSPQVDLEISVPRETALVLSSRVGKVLVDGTRGDVTIKADVGEITLTGVLPIEKLDVESRVASIAFSGALAPNAQYHLTSDVGRVSLSIPVDSAFMIDARSDVGDVRVNFALAGRGSRDGIVGREVRGEVGAEPTTNLYLRSRVGEVSVSPAQ